MSRFVFLTVFLLGLAIFIGYRMGFRGNSSEPTSSEVHPEPRGTVNQVESIPAPQPPVAQTTRPAEKMSTTQNLPKTQNGQQQKQYTDPPPQFDARPDDVAFRSRRVSGHLPKAPWARNEKRVNRLSKDHDIEDFVKSVRSKNIAPYAVIGIPYFPFDSPKSSAGSAAGAETPSPVPFERLLGAFEGEIRFDDGKKVWRMFLELSGKIEDSKLKGEITVDISENGITINKTTQIHRQLLCTE